MTSDYQLKKQTLKVSLLMREMSTEELLQGEVYINEYSDLHSGLQLLEEVLNRDTSFFPIHFLKGGFALIQKSSVIYMILEEKDISMYEECGIKAQSVQVFFKEHHSVEGDIYPELPPERCRPLDFFNQGIRFLPMFLEHQKVVFNTENILYVSDSE